MIPTRFTTHRKWAEVSIGSWKYSCCNTSLLSRYENACIDIQRHEYIVRYSKETPQRQYSGHNTPLGHHINCSPVGLGQYNSRGEYCGPHTAAPSVFYFCITIRPCKVLWAHLTPVDPWSDIHTHGAVPTVVFPCLTVVVHVTAVQRAAHVAFVTEPTSVTALKGEALR